MRVKAEDVVSFSMSDGSFSGREETRKLLAVDTESTFSNIAGREDRV